MGCNFIHLVLVNSPWHAKDYYVIGLQDDQGGQEHWWDQWEEFKIKYLLCTPSATLLIWMNEMHLGMPWFNSELGGS